MSKKKAHQAVDSPNKEMSQLVSHLQEVESQFQKILGDGDDAKKKEANFNQGELKKLLEKITESRGAAELLQRNAAMVKDAERVAHLGSWEEALRLSEERFANAFEHASIGMAMVSPDGHWLKVNRALCQLIGYTAEELLSKTFQEITHPEDLEADLEQLGQVLAGNIHFYQMEKRYFHKLGHIITILLSVSLVRDAEGEPLYFVSHIQDISERKESEVRLKRLNRLYSVLSRINETIIEAGDEKALCEKACQIAVEQGQLKMAWVGEVDLKTSEVIPFVSAGVDDGYLESLKVSTLAGPAGDGPGGRAIREGRPVVSHDVVTYPGTQSWKDAALERGYRSIAAFPLNLGGNRQGLIVFYASEPNFFQKEEMDLMVSVSENISFAIESIRKEQSRLATEETLRKSEELYRLLFFDNPHPMWVYDRETLKFLAVNSAALIEYGYLETEFLGMTVRNLRPPDELPKFDAMMSALPTGRSAAISRHCKKNGEVIDVEVLSDAIVLDGRKARLVAATNVTEQKHFERKLAEQAALLDEARDAIILRDMNHDIRFWNKGAERIYGWSAEEAVGQNAVEFFYPGRDKFDLASSCVLERGAWYGELEHIGKGGEPLIVESRWSLLRDDSGAPKAVLCINTDVTERKKMEGHFLRAQRMESIGTLAGGIAHDLNNLLAPIIMGVDLLKHFGVAGPARGVVDDIERSAKRGSSLVKQVLSFARGVEGERVSMSVTSIIAEVESIVLNTFPKDIVMETRTTDETLCIEGDPTQINQVLLNLCVNARDAMPHGGRIEIAVEAVAIEGQYETIQRGVVPGPYVCIALTDTGCGIPQSNIEKIFDPFFTTKELTKGTGLGLATTLGIVRSHHGFLNVYSEVGKGTAFKIYLPAQTAELNAKPKTAEPDDWPRGNGEWVLLIDDETSILTVTQQTLEAFGYNVLTAENGALGLGVFAANRNKIDLVLTDMMMPVMDGAATILALREIDPGIKIIASSGLNFSGNSTKAAIAGVAHFLAKPYTTGVMLNMVQTALKEEAPRS